MDESINFELGMIRMCLMLNPENENLSLEQLEKLVVQEYQESK